MVKYLVANEVPRVRFPDGAFLAFVAQLAARGSHNPKVAGSTPVESKLIPVSLGGQDTRLSPERPGFNSRTGNLFVLRLSSSNFFKLK